MNPYIQEKLAAFYRDAMESEAEAYRVFKEAFPEADQPATSYDRALAQLGRWLVGAGKRLEERHGERALTTTHNKTLPSQAPVALSHSHQMAVSKGLRGL